MGLCSSDTGETTAPFQITSTTSFSYNGQGSLQSCRHLPGRLWPQGADYGRERDAWFDAHQEEVRPLKAPEGCQDRWLSAHDCSDCRAYRDPDRAGCRGDLVLLQYLLNPGPRGRCDGSAWRPCLRLEGRD